MSLAMLASGIAAGPAIAESVTVAVAANFAPAAGELADAFQTLTGHEIVLVSGSTGQLYAQITRGAPFDVFLAADIERPRRLIDEGFATPGSLMTYAVGRLVLWSRDLPEIDSQGMNALDSGAFLHVAIANPDVAPYGLAARQTLQNMGLWESVAPRVAYGQSVGQAFAMAATGTAELGLVALSQALAFDGPSNYVIVPEALHDPIAQGAVIVERASANESARAFMTFLTGDRAAEILRSKGYVPATTP